MTLMEVQVDRLVGPTHHFGGLGVGNLASHKHAGDLSNPQAAALQGLDKIKLVASFGVPQVILPPQPRPNMAFLRSLGFDGRKGNDDAEVVRHAIENEPLVASAALSSSAMWVANAATVSAGVDNGKDGAALTVANLNASLHRSMEPQQSESDLRQSLASSCIVYGELPGGAAMRDEGAANHMRLGTGQNAPGIHLFVFGDGDPSPNRYWPRQTRLASEAIARQHKLDSANTFFLKQNPKAIDAGAFHNDVVAASHHGILIHHEHAFDDAEDTLRRIEQRYRQLFDAPLQRIVVTDDVLPLDAAVSTYLFNSQIVSPVEDQRKPIIICPTQVDEDTQTKQIVEGWCCSGGIFADASFVDLSQSMAGGGGPACLRLRIPMTPDEIGRIPGRVRWSDALDGQLREVIRLHYPTSMQPAAVTNPSVLEQVVRAESAVRRVLGAEK